MAININGDGLVEVGGTSTTQGRVRLAEDTDNGTNYVELTAPASVTSNRTVTFPDADVNFSTGLGVAQGGTGATTLTANNVILGNGTSAVQFVAPGTSGNVLTSNGTTWQSTTPSVYAGPQAQAFTGNGTFTIPTGITRVKVTVVGGGGGGARGVISTNGTSASGGAGGGTAIKWLSGLTPGNTLSVTVGGGGAGRTSTTGSGTAGGNSSVASGTQTISTITGNGGGGGQTGNDAPGATGGSASGGDINITGGASEAAVGFDNDTNPCVQSNFNTCTGGGNSFIGAGGRSGAATTSTAGEYGGGGGAEMDANASAGGGGIVIFEY